MRKHDGSNSDNLLLREIYKKLMSIEEEVEKLKSKPEYHIKVEKLDVQQLENLIFRLDTLDIGNNFDTKKPTCKVVEKNSTKRKGKKTCKDEEES